MDEGSKYLNTILIIKNCSASCLKICFGKEVKLSEWTLVSRQFCLGDQDKTVFELPLTCTYTRDKQDIIRQFSIAEHLRSRNVIGC